MHAAQEYTETLKRHFGDRLVSVVVYGSVARGEHTPLSDIDLLIVARELPASYHARSRMLAVMEDDLLPLLLSLHRQGIHTSFSTTIKTPEEAARLTPLYLDMVEDAAILYDQGFFFQSVLDRLRKRLQALGARRLQRGKVRYWQLKPDYAWGEIVEL